MNYSHTKPTLRFIPLAPLVHAGQPSGKHADGTVRELAPADADRFSDGELNVLHKVDDSTNDSGARIFTFTAGSTTALRNIQIVQPVHLDLDPSSYVIAPGAMYDGNRMLVSHQPYCPDNVPLEGVCPDGPLLQSDLPRLTLDSGYRADFAANAFSSPFVGIFDACKQRGYLIEIEIYGAWGVTGVNVLTLPDQPVTVEICLPVMRKIRYGLCKFVPAHERGLDIESGKSVTVRVVLHPVAAKTPAAFLGQLAALAHARRGKAAYSETLTLAAAAELVEAKHNALNWDEANAFYRNSSSPKGYALQTGWTGGGMTAYAMLLSPHAQSRERARRMFDTLCRDGLSPSGYFHGGHSGTRWFSVGFRRPGCWQFSLVRRPLECTRDVLKALVHLRSLDETLNPIWELAARRNLDAILATETRYGHLGYIIDFETGDVRWGDTCAGVFGIEALMRGAAWFDDSRYLAAAGRLAEYYCIRFLEKGIVLGGVSDALHSADSESTYALLGGLMHLYKATRDTRHLDWARQAGDHFCTWVLSYDARFAPGTPLARLGVQPRGAVFANTQNQHGAPGICTASGEALLALYEATDERRYLDALKDLTNCMPQFVVRPGQEDIWGDTPTGCMTERVMTMDGLEPNGYTQQMSTWPEISLLLAARELPAALH